MREYIEVLDNGKKMNIIKQSSADILGGSGTKRQEFDILRMYTAALVLYVRFCGVS